MPEVSPRRGVPVLLRILLHPLPQLGVVLPDVFLALLFHRGPVPGRKGTGRQPAARGRADDEADELGHDEPEEFCLDDASYALGGEDGVRDGELSDKVPDFRAEIAQGHGRKKNQRLGKNRAAREASTGFRLRSLPRSLCQGAEGIEDIHRIFAFACSLLPADPRDAVCGCLNAARSLPGFPGRDREQEE